MERFFNKYGHGLPDEKPLELRQTLWRLGAMSGFRSFGPGYTCYTTFPIMVAAWSGYFVRVGTTEGSRRRVVRMAANSNSRFPLNPSSTPKV